MKTKGITQLRVRLEDGTELTVRGREAWALAELIQAGKMGVTPSHRPAARWSEYVRRLRRKGILICTLREKHGGPYPGHHGRYLLNTKVTVLNTIYESVARLSPLAVLKAIREATEHLMR